MGEKKYSIMLIDDHPIIHDGLKTLLAHEPDMEISMTSMSAAEAEEKLAIDMPDIAIIDLSLGDSDGTYLIQRLQSKYPKLRILVYTMSEEKLFAERTANAGANGYIMKTSPPGQLKEAIRSLLAGELYFTPETLKRINRKKAGRSPGQETLLDLLSNREMDIFKLIGQGMDTQEMAEKLNITRNTMDTHRINIKNKLELPNSKAVDRFAYEVIQRGMIPS